MALILCIESTTTNCSVSIARDGEVISIKEDASSGYSHGEQLHPFIDNVLKKSGLQKKELQAVAVSKGPGSYTGLRIGISAAKGLSYALDIPLIATSTLQSLAMQVSKDAELIIAALDARRMEVYSAIFDANFTIIEPVKAEILTAQSYSGFREKNIVFIGNAVEKTRNLLEDSSLKIKYIKSLPSAKEMAVIAESKFKKSDFEDVAYFEPYYLKDFVAIKPKPLV